MAWTDLPQTKIEICLILGLPVSAPRWVDWVERAMVNAEARGGAALTGLIEGYVTAYRTAETALTDSSDQAGLIKADVLEWAPGARQSGYSSEMKRIQNVILNSLFTEPERAQIRKEGMGLSSGIPLKVDYLHSSQL
jgi:hypothetical protein